MPGLTPAINGIYDRHPETYQRETALDSSLRGNAEGNWHLLPRRPVAAKSRTYGTKTEVTLRRDEAGSSVFCLLFSAIRHPAGVAELNTLFNLIARYEQGYPKRSRGDTMNAYGVAGQQFEGIQQRQVVTV